MAATSTRKTTITFTGDVTGTHVLNAATNAASPASIEIKNLASGANTITVPTGGATVRACTIVPPTGNTIALTLKGVTGDTGVGLNLTDPTTIAIGAAVTDFCITAASALTGLRLFWS